MHFRTARAVTGSQPLLPRRPAFETIVLEAMTAASAVARELTAAATDAADVAAAGRGEPRGPGPRADAPLISQLVAETVCPICFDMMALAHVLSCGHAFCYACVAVWLGIR